MFMNAEPTAQKMVPRKTIHLIGVGSARTCRACGEMILDVRGKLLEHIAVIHNPTTWEAYGKGGSFTRCIDTPDPLPAPAKYPVPTVSGVYWAKWRLADEGTDAGIARLLPSDKWEPVKVDADPIDKLRVTVFDEAQSQSLENFVWGPRVQFPKELA